MTATIEPRTRFRGFSSGLAPGSRATPRLAEFLLPLLVALALLLGGGGSPAPAPELALEGAALAVLVAAYWGAAGFSRHALGFVAVLAAVPVLQLVPLPPEVWTALPGRAVEREALALVGAAGRWMPLSQTPDRTLAAVLALIPPGVALLLAASAGRRSRALTLVAVASLAVVSVIVGAAQLAGGGAGPFYFYGPEHGGYVTGFQANRNAAADVLAIGWLALAASVAASPARFAAPSRRFSLGAALVLLGGGALLTGSRAGIALFVVAAMTSGWWVVGKQPSALRRSAWALFLPGLLAALGAAAFIGSGPLKGVAGRFAATADPRAELWSDTAYAIRGNWPAGSGMGSFVPVFTAAERLEAVDASRPNRAHNDYLELALEAGLPGLLVLVGLGLWLAMRLAARWRTAHGPAERAELVFAAGALALLAAHSVVDYPLRSMALATLAGVAAGFILDRRKRGSRETGDGAAIGAEMGAS